MIVRLDGHRMVGHLKGGLVAVGAVEGHPFAGPLLKDLPAGRSVCRDGHRHALGVHSGGFVRLAAVYGDFVGHGVRRAAPFARAFFVCMLRAGLHADGDALHPAGVLPVGQERRDDDVAGFGAGLIPDALFRVPQDEVAGLGAVTAAAEGLGAAFDGELAAVDRHISAAAAFSAADARAVQTAGDLQRAAVDREPAAVGVCAAADARAVGVRAADDELAGAGALPPDGEAIGFAVAEPDALRHRQGRFVPEHQVHTALDEDAADLHGAVHGIPAAGPRDCLAAALRLGEAVLGLFSILHGIEVCDAGLLQAAVSARAVLVIVLAGLHPDLDARPPAGLHPLVGGGPGPLVVGVQGPGAHPVPDALFRIAQGEGAGACAALALADGLAAAGARDGDRSAVDRHDSAHEAAVLAAADARAVLTAGDIQGAAVDRERAAIFSSIAAAADASVVLASAAGGELAAAGALPPDGEAAGVWEVDALLDRQGRAVAEDEIYVAFYLNMIVDLLLPGHHIPAVGPRDGVGAVFHRLKGPAGLFRPVQGVPVSDPAAVFAGGGAAVIHMGRAGLQFRPGVFPAGGDPAG